jgi:hypothetical protein
MVGNWIALHANLEGRPVRFTLTITLGELPTGWASSGRHARTWSAIAGLVLLSPFALLIAASALSSVGYHDAYGWIASSPYAILAATISLFIGIPVAIAMNLWRIAQAGLRRGAGMVEGLVALELAPLHLIVVLVAFVIGAAFVGHLAADSYACIRGVSSAC